MKQKIKLAVSDFALPSPRKGSIELYSGYGRAAELGIEIHQAIQAQRKAEFSYYQSEVSVAHSFKWGGYEFEIAGRMDGLFESEDPKIEEIKSCFNVYDLLRKLKDSSGDHPYIWQIKTYGYFYWLKNNVIPDLNLHLVSSRSGDSVDFPLKLSVREYEDWLERRSKELVSEAMAAEKRLKRRKKTSLDMVFPFDKPRSGQTDLIATIEEAMVEKRPIMIQAPTGLGKTMGVMFPVLKEALSRGQKLVYVTPKNSQHSVAEDAVERLQERGAKVKVLTLTAKSKMCFKNEPLCNPEFCEYAKDHYTKMAEHRVTEELSKKRGLTAKKFKNIAEKYQVCPFEIQLDAAKDVDVVVCDYNYVFAPRTAFGRLAAIDFGQEGKPNLVIDEAHNLPSRSMDYYSPNLSVAALQKILEDASKLPLMFQAEVKSLIHECIAVVEQSGPRQASRPVQITPPVSAFLEQDEKLRSFLSSYLNSNVEIEAKDAVLRLCFYWSEFSQALEFVAAGRDEFFTTYHSGPATVKITCCDAAEMLKASYAEYSQVVAFSATLKPFEFYSRLSGLSDKQLRTAEFVSPFPKDRRKLLIIPQISSKYSEREKNYSRIADAIHKICSMKSGNYFAFFPSFDFMERVYHEFGLPEGFQVLKQERNMRREDIDEVVAALKHPSGGHVIFAVQGGVFSEGVDYPGDMIIGAFVVGPPLPQFNLEREKMKAYYQSHYEAGFDYAYTYPAMAKAIQSAGRVIRSETDRGLIVLMDNRFIQASYSKSMPQDWFERTPNELVSESILSEVGRFWSQGVSSLAPVQEGEEVVYSSSGS